MITKSEERQSTVLLVDDEPEIRTILKDLLADNHFPLKVIEAADGSEAMRKLENERIAILVTDIKMPRINGNKILEELSLLEPENRPQSILVLTGVAQECGFYPIGDVTVISKPATAKKLLAYFTEAVKVRPENQQISSLGLRHLQAFIGALANVMAVTFKVKVVPKLNVIEAITNDSVQSYMKIAGKGWIGYVKISVDSKLVKHLLAHAVGEASNLESPNANSVVAEIANQVTGIGRVYLQKMGFSSSHGLPVVASGELEVPKELQIRRPALAYMVNDFGNIKLELMIERLASK